MVTTYELGTRLADSSLEYVDGKIKVGASIQEAGARKVYLDVRDYAPGRVLTQANFQDSIEAALADAVVKSNTTVLPFVGAQVSSKPRYMVRVPEGMWHLTRTLRLLSSPQTTQQALTPGICGVNKDGSILFVDSAQFTATNNAVIYIGGDVTDQYVHQFLMHDIQIQAHAGVSSLDAIVIDTAYVPNFENVMIFGFKNNQGRSDRGWGLKVQNKLATEANNQYIRLVNCWFLGCTGGVWFDNCLPVHARDVYCKQSTFADVYVDGTHLHYVGGSIESTNGGGASYTNASGKMLANVITGWALETASGTGAAIGVRSGDTTTVTGLAGITVGDVHKWLYLEKSSGAYDGSDLSSGYYLITRYISPTSVEILKGSAHTATTGMLWSLRLSRDTSITVEGKTYHEALAYYCVGSFQSENGGSSVTVKDSVWANVDFAVAALGSPTSAGAEVTVEHVRQSTQLVKARNCPSVTALQATRSAVGDLDVYSLDGLICRAGSYTNSGAESLVHSATLPSAIRSAHLPGGSARVMCELGGASNIWDARVASSFVRSGSDITSWTDLIGGVVAGLQNPGVFPQYSASDPTFGGKPSVTFTGGATAATSAALLATLPSASFGSYRHQPCVVMVGASSSAVEHPANTASRLSLYLPANAASLSILMCDYNFGGGAFFYGGWTVSGDSSDTQPLSVTPDTAAHVFMHGGAGKNGPRVQTETRTRLMTNWVNNPNSGGWPAGSDHTLRMLDTTVATKTGTFSAAFICVFPEGLGTAARKQLTSQLAQEFGINY